MINTPDHLSLLARYIGQDNKLDVTIDPHIKVPCIEQVTKKIYLPTKICPKITENLNARLQKASLFHEIGHGMYSGKLEQRNIQNLLRQMDKDIDTWDGVRKEWETFKHYFNAVEDIRVNKHLLTEYPQLKKIMDKEGKEIYQRLWAKKKIIQSPIMALHLLLRKKHLDQDYITIKIPDDHRKIIDETIDILGEDYPDHNWTGGIRKSILGYLKIRELLKTEDPEKRKQAMSQGGLGILPHDFEKGGKKEGKGKGMKSKAFKIKITAVIKAENDAKGESTDTGTISVYVEGLSEDLGELTPKLKRSGQVGGGTINNIKYKSFDANKSTGVAIPEPTKAKRIGHKIADEITRGLQISNRTRFKQKRGQRLDMRAIVKQYTKYNKIVDGRILEKDAKLWYDHTVCVAIDLSGSMGGGRKMENAKQALATFGGMLERLNIKFGFYGFGAEAGKDVVADIIIKDFGEKLDFKKINNASNFGYYGNRDGDSIRLNKKRLTGKQGKKILIVINDGSPQHDGTAYTGMSARKDTIKAIKEAQGSKINMFGISIDRNADDFIKEAYGKNSFCFLDLDKMPKRLVDTYIKIAKGL